MAIEANVKLLTSEDVALAAGVKVDTVRKWVQRKLIKPSRKIGTAHIFTETECRRFCRKKRRAGNPSFIRSK